MTYRELQAILERMDTAVGAAEAHGWLCGALCVRRGYGDENVHTGSLPQVAVTTRTEGDTVRIGIATAAAWAYARAVPVVGVSTLEVLAEGTAMAAGTGMKPSLDTTSWPSREKT